MTAAAAVCCTALLLFTRGRGPGAVLLGLLGPLVAALATWVLVARAHTTAPERVSGVMVKLFGAKMVFFAAYVTAVVLLLDRGTTLFVASFVCHYILLHVMEALYLRRLFAGAGQHWRVG